MTKPYQPASLDATHTPPSTKTYSIETVGKYGDEKTVLMCFVSFSILKHRFHSLINLIGCIYAQNRMTSQSKTQVAWVYDANTSLTPLRRGRIQIYNHERHRAKEKWDTILAIL